MLAVGPDTPVGMVEGIDFPYAAPPYPREGWDPLWDQATQEAAHHEAMARAAAAAATAAMSVYYEAMLWRGTGIGAPWAQKHRPPGAGHRSDAVTRPAQATQEVPEAERTTVMLRNLPNSYTRQMLLELIDAEGFEGEYDFVYLPTDFTSHAGLGYTFVNLISPDVARRFWEHFDGFSKWALKSSKVCTPCWSMPHQGLKPHIERYRNSPVMHESVPDECKPLVFANGVRVSFPPPVRTVKAPRIRGRNAETLDQSGAR